MKKKGSNQKKRAPAGASKRASAGAAKRAAGSKPARAKAPAKSQATAQAKTSSKKPSQAPSKIPSKAARTKAPAEPDREKSSGTDKILAAPLSHGPDLMADLAELEGIPARDAGSADMPASREEKMGLEKVMASLTQIFGGRDFMSDAELDALLDDKMASGEIPPSAALDPLDEAQSLIYEAWNSEDVVKVELAHRALDLSPDCADAYIILAEKEAESREAALALYRQGVEAGERAVDPGLFVRAAGQFWEIMETRPYLRARLGLAECLWDLGRKEDALGHLRDLIRLNPSDNQGVRYILLQCLMESGADDEVGALLDRYGDDASPQIKFTRALWLFRRQGPGASSDLALAEAVEANPHVPDYLLRRKKLSRRRLSAARPGSEEEAEAYAGGAMDPWHDTLGALEWLAHGASP